MWRRPSQTVMIVSEAPAEPVLNSAFLCQPHIRLLSSGPDEDGLRLARRKQPSLIIEDLQAPDVHGLAFCRDLRAHPVTRRIPLILVADPTLHGEARAANADALLDKPLVRGEYFNAVRRFIPLPKRRTERIAANLRFTYDVGGHQGQAFSRDISPSGAFIKSDRVLPVGTRLTVRFCLPGTWDALQCTAIVRFNSQGTGHPAPLGGFGIEFEGLGEDDAERLDVFLARQLERPLLAR